MGTALHSRVLEYLSISRGELRDMFMMFGELYDMFVGCSAGFTEVVCEGVRMCMYINRDMDRDIQPLSAYCFTDLSKTEASYPSASAPVSRSDFTKARKAFTPLAAISSSSPDAGIKRANSQRHGLRFPRHDRHASMHLSKSSSSKPPLPPYPLTLPTL
jgi:hypothetical protein